MKTDAMTSNPMHIPLEGDLIIIKDLVVRNIIGVDSWERNKRQPIVISLAMQGADVPKAGETDHLPFSIHYGTICKMVTSHAEESTYKSIEALAGGIANVVLTESSTAGQGSGAQAVWVRVEKPRALLHAESAGVEIIRFADGSMPIRDFLFVKNMRLASIIGVNPWERDEKQIVILNLKIHRADDKAAEPISDTVRKMYNFRTIVRTISQHIESSSYKTVEAFVTAVARIACVTCHVPKITVRAEKPSALMFAMSAGVEITRTISDFISEIDSNKFTPVSETVKPSSDSSHIVYFGIGSNVGDRIANINSALEMLKARRCHLLDTSFLYESTPMYVVDQPNFFNAVGKLSTDLTPLDLLKTFKDIENAIGRVKTVDKGPRTIDLDILFYDDLQLNLPDLIIPHPLIHEREFVLRPLCDVSQNLEHPTLFRTVSKLLSHLLVKHPSSPMHKVLPLPQAKACDASFWRLGKRTYVMGILNVTPDSFSDGANNTDIENAIVTAKRLIQEGCDMLDIGGQSTRPNAKPISTEEELARVLPVVKALRQFGIDTPISIDTFRPSVASACIVAGANLINDVTGGKGWDESDAGMFQIVAKTHTPICLTHSRGTSADMTKLTKYENGIIRGWESELGDRVKLAIAAGIPRWNIVIDPGIGFAKDGQQNIELLRNLKSIISSNAKDSTSPMQNTLSTPIAPLAGFPCLVGVSRKAFIGHLTGHKDPKDRTFGTAAACAASIVGGADVIRVHDVKEMRDVAKVMDAIYRV